MRSTRAADTCLRRTSPSPAVGETPAAWDATRCPSPRSLTRPVNLHNRPSRSYRILRFGFLRAPCAGRCTAPSLLSPCETKCRRLPPAGSSRSAWTSIFIQSACGCGVRHRPNKHTPLGWIVLHPRHSRAQCPLWDASRLGTRPISQAPPSACSPRRLRHRSPANPQMQRRGEDTNAACTKPLRPPSSCRRTAPSSGITPGMGPPWRYSRAKCST